MLISSKWEEERLKLHFKKIVSVPLPPQQASKCLQNLQASCSSPIKSIQLEALKCWETWVQNYDSEELEVDSVCHLAMKPLLTKKLHLLHRDADICKLKLKIMWGLLMNVQSKMDLSGPRHILEEFLHSCFTWLSSSESLDSKVSILILKLLLIVFRKYPEAVECDKYIFSAIIIDKSILKMFLITFVEKFLDLFDNWKQYQDNHLIIDLWKCFLEYCEASHNSILTPVWHRVFKVVQIFCSDKCVPIKDRLAFLHTCATNIKMVLLSSKYINGESFFMTPCEVLLLKLIEICKADCEETSDPEIFNMSYDICKVLSNKSVSICDYNLCIDLINAMYDFSLKSFFWGCWCGLMDCFKKSFMNMKLSKLNRNQMKFYRKLRAATVNYELDSAYLHEDVAANVCDNIKSLNIRCFCSLEIPRSNRKDSFSYSDSAAVNKRTVEVEEEESEEVNSENNKIVPFSNSRVKTLLDFGIFGHPLDSCNSSPVNPGIKIFNGTFDRVQKILKVVFVNPFLVGGGGGGGGGMAIVPFPRLKLVNCDSPSLEKDPAVFSRFLEASSPSGKIRISGPRPIEGGKEAVRVIEKDRKRKKNSSGEKKSASIKSEPQNHKSKKSDSNVEKELTTTWRRRSQRNAEPEPEMDTRRKRRRKSYELLVQEIMKNNKLRRAEKNKCDWKGLSYPISDRRVLRSGKKIDSSMNRKTEKMDKSSRHPFDLRSKKGKGGRKKEEKEKNFDSNRKSMNKKSHRKKNLRGKGKGKKKNNLGKKFNVEEEEEEEEKGRKRKDSPGRSLTETGNATTDGREEMKTKWISSPRVILVDITESILDSDEVANEDFEKFFQRESQTKENEIDSMEIETVSNEIFGKNLETSSEPEESSRESDHLEGKPKKVESSDTEIILEPTEENGCETSHALEKSGSETFADESRTVDEESKNESETKEEKKAEAEAVEEKTESEIKVEVSRGKKRPRTEEESAPGEIKKLKMVEEDFRGIERGAEKENVDISFVKEKKDFFSPPKTISNREGMENPNGKMESPKGVKGGDSSPGSIRMATKRTSSSRALKMISLVPESDSCGFHQINLESSAAKSPESGKSPTSKKYLGVDRSSRISKMLLASLTKIPHEEMDVMTDEDKWTREDSSTPNPPTVKISSPKTAKKRKFISFDETKNETIFFEIDTPPSDILIQRRKSKENFASPEKMAAAAAALPSNLSSAT